MSAQQNHLSHLHPQLRPLAVPVNSLTPDPLNARKRDEKAMETLKASIKDRGFRSVIIVQRNAKGQAIIRAGNGRHQACKELGITHIPALVFEEGDDEAVAFALADNRTAELAEWDLDNLKINLESLQSTDISLDMLGFKGLDLDSLISPSPTESEKPKNGDSSESYAEEEENITVTFGVLVETKNSDEQKKVLEEMESRGYTCKLMIS